MVDIIDKLIGTKYHQNSEFKNAKYYYTFGQYGEKNVIFSNENLLDEGYRENAPNLVWLHPLNVNYSSSRHSDFKEFIKEEPKWKSMASYDLKEAFELWLKSSGKKYYYDIPNAG